MTERCDAPECDREAGHKMPHGHPVGPMIIAPWSDVPRQGFEDGEPIPCNSCGAPLVLDPKAARASCSQCDQRISFDGKSYSSTVIAKLYPSKMTEPKMLREFGQYKVDERAFFDTLRVRFGLMTQGEFDENRVKDAEALVVFIAREVLPLEKRRGFLRRLFR
jgi:hypothetical protein